jgi:nucleoside-diphosphate-sugar epimerase
VKPTVVITGANGFVGERLCDALSAIGCPLLGTVRAGAVNLAFPAMDIGEINGDTDWSLALRSATTVVHLAARVHVMKERLVDPVSAFFAVNVEGTLNLARQAAASGAKRFVYVSSIKVNGERTQPGFPFTEKDEAKPKDDYALSKLEAERGLRLISVETGMDLVIVRPPLIYGPGVKANMAALVTAVQKGWPLPLGAVDNRRSLIAIDNLVDFLMICITHPMAVDQTFLVSDDHDLSTTELIQGISRAANLPDRLIPIPVAVLKYIGRMVGKFDAISRLCDNLQIDSSKARTMLDWTPPISVKEGLRRVINNGDSP